MIATPEYLQEFNDEITTSESLPYCQIQNPPNMSLAQINQFDAPWGWFIPNEQAEAAQFKASSNFEPVRLTFGQDTPKQREVDGFLATSVRMTLIHRSGIEVQEKTQLGWRYVGQAYAKGELSSEGEKAFQDFNSFRLRTRYLLLFLDERNQSLHQIPFRLGMGRGTGGSFSEEVKEFRSEIERVFFKLRGEPQKSLSDHAHALSVLDLKLGLHKGDGKAPFVCPVERSAPAIDKVGVEKLVERRERQVKLVGEPIQNLLIPKSSDTGQLILSLWEEYKGFSTRFQNDEASVVSEEEGRKEVFPEEVVSDEVDTPF